MGAFTRFTREDLHLALGGAGSIPVAGIVFDLTDGVLYVCEGRPGEAVLSVIAVVPIVGDAGGALRSLKKSAGAIDHITDLAGSGRKAVVAVSESADEALELANKIAKNSDEVTGAGKATGHAASEVVNGNSRLSTRAQHGYEIVDTTTDEVVKTGVSGGPRTATGGSARANSQANQWSREAGVMKGQTTIFLPFLSLFGLSTTHFPCAPRTPALHSLYGTPARSPSEARLQSQNGQSVQEHEELRGIS